MPDPSAPPSPTLRPAKPTSGCLLWLIALPIVVLLGIVIGTVLSGDDEPADEVRVTLADGELDGTAWRVDAVRDVQGDTCAFLYADDEDQPVTGSCAPEPQDATFGSGTVVFGVAEPDADQVQVRLSDGETISVDTVTADGVDGRFYVRVVQRDVDAAG